MSNSDTHSYDIQKDSWYSPLEIIRKFELVRSVFGKKINNHEFKKAREMLAAAVTLLGAYELSPENKYFMQVNKQSKSPDVVAIKQTEQPGKPLLAEITQMEIVEFEKHFPGNDIVNFLKATKLSLKKSYSEKTMIVCVVNRPIPLNHRKIHRKLNAIHPKPKSTIYITGRVQEPEVETFCIFSAYPTLTKVVKYKLSNTIRKYQIPPRADFNLGMDEKISYKKSKLKPVNTYEILGLNQKMINQKYKTHDK